jgi:hypothetical protein
MTYRSILFDFADILVLTARMRGGDQSWFLRPPLESFPFLTQVTERFQLDPPTVENMTVTAANMGLILAYRDVPSQRVFILITDTLRDLNLLRAEREETSSVFREARGDPRYHNLWTAEDGPHDILRPYSINEIQSLLSLNGRSTNHDEAGSRSNAAPTTSAVQMNASSSVDNSGWTDPSRLHPVPLTPMIALEGNTYASPLQEHSASATLDSEMRYAMFSTLPISSRRR